MRKRYAANLSETWAAVQKLVEAALRNELTRLGWTLVGMRPLEASKNTFSSPYNDFEIVLEEAPFTAQGLCVFGTTPDELLERVQWVEERVSEMRKLRRRQ